MLNPYEKKDKEEKVTDPGVFIEGTFVCPQCRVEVEEALYFPSQSKLGYRCSNDHFSVIENFNLGV